MSLTVQQLLEALIALGQEHRKSPVVFHVDQQDYLITAAYVVPPYIDEHVAISTPHVAITIKKDAGQ